MEDKEQPMAPMFDASKRSEAGYSIWKEIVGTMVGIAPFALMFFIWMSSVQTRLAVLEEARATQAYRDSMQDATFARSLERVEAAQGEIKNQLREMDKYIRDSNRR